MTSFAKQMANHFWPDLQKMANHVWQVLQKNGQPCLTRFAKKWPTMFDQVCKKWPTVFDKFCKKIANHFWPGLQKMATHVWPTTTREMWWPPLPMASLSSSKDSWSTLMPLFWSSHWTPATLAENVYLAQLSMISKSFQSCDCCHVALSSDWQLIISMLSQRLLNSWKQKQHFITLHKNKEFTKT